jgi:hypothetical protein
MMGVRSGAAMYSTPLAVCTVEATRILAVIGTKPTAEVICGNYPVGGW